MYIYTIYIYIHKKYIYYVYIYIYTHTHKHTYMCASRHVLQTIIYRTSKEWDECCTQIRKILSTHTIGSMSREIPKSVNVLFYLDSIKYTLRCKELHIGSAPEVISLLNNC